MKRAAEATSARERIEATVAAIESKVVVGAQRAALRLAAQGVQVVDAQRINGVMYMQVAPSNATGPLMPDFLVFCRALTAMLRAHGYTVLPQERLRDVGAGGRIHIRLEFDAGDDDLAVMIAGLDDDNLILPPVLLMPRDSDRAALS